MVRNYTWRITYYTKEGALKTLYCQATSIIGAHRYCDRLGIDPAEISRVWS